MKTTCFFKPLTEWIERNYLGRLDGTTFTEIDTKASPEQSVCCLNTSFQVDRKTCWNFKGRSFLVVLNATFSSEGWFLLSSIANNPMVSTVCALLLHLVGIRVPVLGVIHHICCMIRIPAAVIKHLCDGAWHAEIPGPVMLTIAWSWEQLWGFSAACWKLRSLLDTMFQLLCAEHNLFQNKVCAQKFI